MSITVVRLSGCGRHNSGWCQTWDKPRKSPSEYAGTPILIYTQPETPDLTWICGTKFVWKVVEQSVLELTGRMPDNSRGVFVCEHQIELD